MKMPVPFRSRLVPQLKAESRAKMGIEERDMQFPLMTDYQEMHFPATRRGHFHFHYCLGINTVLVRRVSAAYTLSHDEHDDSSFNKNLWASSSLRLGGAYAVMLSQLWPSVGVSDMTCQVVEGFRSQSPWGCHW
jgi:hypothetical protein